MNDNTFKWVGAIILTFLAIGINFLIYLYTISPSMLLAIGIPVVVFFSGVDAWMYLKNLQDRRKKSI